ncbi:MAG: hypothetical protein IKO61_04915 [Lachnospiraceae bacterium]|nr:hypothetical protein [Lachnospiraceae bacterium]
MGKKLEITNECAQIFFKNFDYTNDEIYHIESDSYIIYSFGKQIMVMHKQSCIQRVLLEGIEEPARFLKRRKLIAEGDRVYYVLKGILYGKDLNTGETTEVSLIKEEAPIEDTYISDMWLYREKYIIYKKQFSYYMAELDTGIESEKCLDIYEDTEQVYLYGNHLYYLVYDFDDDNSDYEQYRLMRYGLLNNEDTAVTDYFARHKGSEGIKAIYRIMSEGIDGDYFYCVFEYEGVGSMDRGGFDCYYMRMSPSSKSQVHQFFIWTPHLYQMEHYNGKLIYINASKGFSLIVHNHKCLSSIRPSLLPLYLQAYDEYALLPWLHEPTYDSYH